MVSNAIQGFQTNIALAFRPQLVQSYASSDYTRTKKLFFSLSKISYLLLLAIAVPVIIEINIILKIWLGDNIPDYTVPFTILAIVSLVLSSLHAPLTQIIHASGKMKTFQIAMGVIISSVVPISWLFLKVGYSPVVIYWVAIVITIVNHVVCLFITKAIFPFSINDYLTKIIVPCTISTILIPIIPTTIEFIMAPSLYRLILVCIIDIICAASVIYFLALDKSEKNIVNQYLIRFKKSRLPNKLHQ